MLYRLYDKEGGKIIANVCVPEDIVEKAHKVAEWLSQHEDVVDIAGLTLTRRLKP